MTMSDFMVCRYSNVCTRTGTDHMTHDVVWCLISRQAYFLIGKCRSHRLPERVDLCSSMYSQKPFFEWEWKKSTVTMRCVENSEYLCSSLDDFRKHERNNRLKIKRKAYDISHRLFIFLSVPALPLFLIEETCNFNTFKQTYFEINLLNIGAFGNHNY